MGRAARGACAERGARMGPGSAPDLHPAARPPAAAHAAGSAPTTAAGARRARSSGQRSWRLQAGRRPSADDGAWRVGRWWCTLRPRPPPVLQWLRTTGSRRIGAVTCGRTCQQRPPSSHGSPPGGRRPSRPPLTSAPRVRPSRPPLASAPRVRPSRRQHCPHGPRLALPRRPLCSVRRRSQPPVTPSNGWAKLETLVARAGWRVGCSSPWQWPGPQM